MPPRLFVWVAILMLVPGLVLAKPPDLPLPVEDSFTPAHAPGGAIIEGRLDRGDAEEQEPRPAKDSKTIDGCLCPAIHQTAKPPVKSGKVRLKVKVKTRKKIERVPAPTEVLEENEPEVPSNLPCGEAEREHSAQLFRTAEEYTRAGLYAEALTVYSMIRGLCWGTQDETRAAAAMNALGYLLSESAEAAEPAVPQVQQDACPYLHKKESKSSQPQDCPSVEDNLRKLEKAAQMYKKAEQMLHEGDADRAAVYYSRIRKLVPGSRYDQMASDRLARLDAPMPEKSGVEEATAPDGDEEPSSLDKQTSRLEKKLDTVVSFDFHEAPLWQVLDDFRFLHGVKLAADQRALDEENIDLDRTVTLRGERVKLKMAVNQIARHAGLSTIVKDGVLLVTTRRVAEGPVVTACYDVSDLVEVKATKGRLASRRNREREEQNRAEKVVEVVTANVRPTTWAAHGGIGTIEFCPTNRSLVVNHVAEALEEVEGVLARLREQQTIVRPRVVQAAPENDERIAKMLGDCHAALMRGDRVRAQELALRALERDPARVAADPLVYKMNMLQDLVSTRLQPTLPPVDPTIVQAYEQILEMAPPRCLEEPAFGTEPCEKPMSYLPPQPGNGPTNRVRIDDDGLERIGLDFEEELEVVVDEASQKGRPSSLCVDVDLASARGKRMQVQWQLGRLTFRMVRDQGKGSVTLDYTADPRKN